MCDLAMLFNDPNDPLYNKEEALKLYKMAADKGNEQAKSDYLSIMKELEFINKKKEADNGNVESLVDCSLMLFNGEGVEPDSQKSIELLKVAIEKGNSRAMNIYGAFLYQYEKNLLVNCCLKTSNILEKQLIII